MKNSFYKWQIKEALKRKEEKIDNCVYIPLNSFTPFMLNRLKLPSLLFLDGFSHFEYRSFLLKKAECKFYKN